MAKKYEFQPDKPYSSWLNKLQMTKQQRRQMLKWCLYGLMLIIASVFQDVVFCRMRFLGGTFDLVPCCIFLICVLEGSHSGCVFALVTSYLYYLSGTAPGPHVVVLITVIAVLVAVFRQAYLHYGFPAALLCTVIAMSVYELSIFTFCLLLGRTTPDRFIGFMVPVLLSVVTIPIIHPVARAIASTGGEAWKE